MRSLARAAIVIAAGGLAGASMAQQANIIAYPGLPSAIDTPNSGAVGIGNAGHVVGTTNLYGYDPVNNISYPGIVHTFLSPDPATATDLGVLGVDPPPLQFPRGDTLGTRVNNLDQVACVCTDALSTSIPRGAIWLPQPAYGLPAGLTALPPLVSLYIDRAFGLNDVGQIVGESRTETHDIRPVLWTVANGAISIVDLAPGLGPNGRAFAINNLGEAVGQLNEPNPIPFDNYFQAFLYLPAPAYGLPAGVNILQAPGLPTADNFGFPNDINEQGQIVGRTAGFAWVPALWLPAPALGLPAGVTVFPRPVFAGSVFNEIGSIGLASAEFTAINEGGIAVGEAVFNVEVQFPRPRIVGESHAFIWRGGRFEILDDLKPPGSPWVQIFRAAAINDQNEIVATALNDAGDYRAVKITLDAPPCPSGFFRQPAAQHVCTGEDLVLSVWAVAGGGGDLTYQWRRDGEPLSDGPTPSGSVIAGAATNQLTITAPAVADGGSYDVMITNNCNPSISDPAAVTACPADFNCSGDVSVQDIFDFLVGYFGDDPRADVNRDGGISVQDIFDYLRVYFTGCA